ncbi:hypothetical protein PPYR_02711 [Photinus pyralis]|uniref:Major facilitator superfamily (MFS) profile domain-containing protein n=1 Tax=Photinus pyralis TaxID=7054 RepID=A0A5N4A0T4_PHOPY|nr:facilitated trehalose transporter Tret1-like [Photinus pyralis]XP_031331495.1 facilitated trehalose transporter Tret1-like [Photinus pyralis]KAB0790911.1 hypothetical protein PPYR_02711 [Photinus pyralis]
MFSDIISNARVYILQMYAATVVSLVYMNVAISVAYSAVLIPALKNSADPIEITDQEEMWIVNCVSLVIPCVCVLPGYATDLFGRLWVLKMTVIAHVAGWVTIALANSGTTLIIGRVIVGLGLAFQLGPCFVYISEISSPTMRGALLIFPTLTFSLGTLLVYLEGYFASWRAVAWFSCGYGVIFISLLYTIPSSPFWLVAKQRTEDAKKALEWLNKYQPIENVQQIVQTELGKIQEEQEENRIRCKTSSKVQEFFLPTTYKPFIILTLLLIIQQFAGSYVVVMNAIIFFQEIGTKTDPYLASTYMAATRFLTTFIYVILTKKFGKRPVLMVSFLGMAISMAVSGLYTYWIRTGTTEYTWVPLVMLFLYYVFTAGVLGIPFSLAGELFPVPVRGIACNVAFGLLYFFSFIAVSSYPLLLDGLGGMDGLQYFFAMVALVGVAFTFLFVPETANKRLAEIEKYFWSHTFAIFESREDKLNEDKISKKNPKKIFIEFP